MRRISAWQWAMMCYALVLGIATLIWLRALPHFAHIPIQIDFASYYDAAQSLRTGRSIYEPAVPGVIPFLYPPLIATLWVPLSWLPYTTAALVWYLFNLLAWGMVGVVVVQLFPMPAWPRRLLILTTVMLPAMSDTVLLGQVTHLVTIAILLIWWALVRQRTAWAGIIVGFLLTIKVQLVGLLLLLMVQKKWHAGLGALCVCGVLIAAGVWWWGWELTATWLDSLRFKASVSVTHPVNQSLWAGVARMFLPTPIRTGGMPAITLAALWEQPWLAQWGALCVVGVVGLGTLWWCWRHPADALTDTVCTIPLMLWCAPVSWDHYTAHLVIPIAWLWQRATLPWHVWRLTLVLILLVSQRLWRVWLGWWPSPVVLLSGTLALGVVWWSVLSARSTRGMMEHTA